MKISITSRAVGWRPRGRPPTEVPPEIIELLQSSYVPPRFRGDPPKVDIIAEPEDTEEEIRQMMTLLRAGARRLGKHLAMQRHDRTIKFYLADLPRKDRP